jgi:two-component system sensor histidine kinase BarA
MTDVLNIQLSLEQAAGNEDLAKELFGMLLKELPDLRKMLTIAIRENDLQGCWDHAHRIYGSTAYCGVPALREAARQMETSVKAEDMKQIQENFSQLSREIERVIEHGKQALTKNWIT